jgi:hypothetical protein
MQRTRFALALALLLAIPTFAAAQVPAALANSTPAERAAIQTDLMKEKLALTAEQAPRVQAINLDTAQKMEPVIKGTEAPVARMRQARAIENQKEAALQGVLTPDQFQKFLALRDEMKQKLEERLAKKAAGTP